MELPAHDRLLAYAREIGWRVGWTGKRGDGRFKVTCWVQTDWCERPHRFGSDMDDRRTLEQAIEFTAALAWGAIGPKTPSVF